MSEPPEVSLIIAGRLHDGWESVSIHHSIEEVAPTFNVDYTPRWSPDGSPVPIEDGDPVEIRMGDTLVLTGFVDDTLETYDAATHKLSCSGRSRTGLLVDSSAEYKGGHIAGKNLKQIAELLCAPFEITVSLSSPDIDIGGPIAEFAIQEGESVMQALNDLARQEGILFLSDPRGNLVLARAASVALQSIEIRTGENIEGGSLRSSSRDRHSVITIKGQVAGTDEVAGAAAAQIKHSITDEGVKRHKPLTIVDHHASVARLRRRALWERNTRAGRGRILTYDVAGWTHVRGLWAVNTLVGVVDTTLGIEKQMLITAVDFDRTLERGRMTHLDVMARETFDVLKPPKPPKRVRKRKPSILD